MLHQNPHSPKPRVLQVIKVPTNKKCMREDVPTVVTFRKDDANALRLNIVRDALLSGLPLLIGTSSTAVSQVVYHEVQDEKERLRCSPEGRMSDVDRVVVSLLNSDEKLAAQESMLVAQAGVSQRVTVATNMAGRGTDILLGGDPDKLLLQALAHPHNAAALELWRASKPRGSASAVAKAQQQTEQAAAGEVQVRGATRCAQLRRRRGVLLRVCMCCSAGWLWRTA